ncbi:hypothetical protein IAR55_002428 [Kwoniella newhampshirensis]|uniref:IPT/TIG domain-containing protein n=1 Tax=Kwoniella newhampshirensis TaxID=1651941 RepID=A0AAW0YQT7_9TREE
MSPMDSSSTSSPFSTRSTIPSSSPEAMNGGGEPVTAAPNGYGHGVSHGSHARTTGQDVMHGMQALLSSFNGTSFSPQPPFSSGQSRFSSSPPQQQDVKPIILPDVKPFTSLPHPMVGPSRLSDPSVDSPLHSNATSMNSSHSHGGLRADPPKRMYEVDDLPRVFPSLDELAVGSSNQNQLLLQGDPLHSDKSRVETAIRVIIDILRFAATPSPSPMIHPSLLPILPRDASGNILMTFERIATFHGLRLQAGTTTKASSKKQLQAGPIAKQHLAYVETAVYMSGENGKRVYVCKRCRNREARRRASKEVNRKRQPNSDSDNSSTKPKPRQSLVPPSQDFITSENPDQYDPHRNQQIVEEPPWDPDHRDWRHEIVLFNSPPEIKIDDGSCNWLPFRVVCYGKCHGEKVGFKIQFTLRTWDGRIIATSTTKPIRITDDHKTEPKLKTKVDGMTSTQAPTAIPRARKGRQSTASSRRQSPTPSESESIQSMSEAGAVLQKQTPSVRAGKPYERPPSQSPATSTLTMESLTSNNFQRQQSSTSLNSMHQPEPKLPQAQPLHPASHGLSGQHLTNTVSPGALRASHFSIGQPDLSNGLPGAGRASAPSSNVASPVSQMVSLGGHDNILFGNSMQSPHSIMSTLGLNGVQQIGQQQAMLFSQDHSDVEMTSVVTSGLEDLFPASSQTSLSSSLDDRGSMFSVFADNRSSAMFSESGLPPSTDIDQFLDYTGGEHSDVSNPFHPDNAMTSPAGQTFPPLPFDDLHLSPTANALDLSPSAQAQQDAQLNDMLAAIAQGPQAQITHVIPGDGPMAGGTKIAIAGRAFQPGMVVVFGQRPAPTDFVSDGFVQCKLPPSSFPGEVEVTVQGSMRVPEAAPMLFKYNDMDKDLMRLALEVRNQYQGSSSEAAYRLAHQVATRSVSASEWSERSSSNSPMSGASPGDVVEEDDRSYSTGSGSKASDKSDLQSTIIAFLASLDENAPGSLRASGAINHRNEAQQTLLHIATVMGFHRLVRRLIVVGAHIDVQDTNGYTPLAFAALCGRHTCARVLIEAGASYDRPTSYGEMPLDLAKYGEHGKVEALLLSAVWSTSTAAAKEADEREIAGELSSSRSIETSSEIDDDNPSSGSEIESDIAIERSRLNRRRSRVAKGKGKRRASSAHKSERDRQSPRSTRRASLDSTPQPTPLMAAHPSDEPPPYAPPAGRGISALTDSETDHSSWMSRTLTAIPHPHPNFKLPGAVWDHLPIPSSIFGQEKRAMAGMPAEQEGAPPHGWVAFPAPSWETLQKMASPEEVKLFTQAMAAAAFNAVVQSGVTTTGTVGTSSNGEGRRLRRQAQAMDEWEGDQRIKERRRRKSGGGGKDGRRSGSVSPGEKVVKHVKRDRMLYLFWLPVLLFVGFWLLVTALPIATGFSLIYARQITRAIKQRM